MYKIWAPILLFFNDELHTILKRTNKKSRAFDFFNYCLNCLLNQPLKFTLILYVGSAY